MYVDTSHLRLRVDLHLSTPYCGAQRRKGLGSRSHENATGGTKNVFRSVHSRGGPHLSQNFLREHDKHIFDLTFVDVLVVFLCVAVKFSPVYTSS